MKKQYIETGKIVGTHGIKGEIRVQPWSDSPASLINLKTLYLEQGKVPMSISSARVHGNVVLIKFEDVDTVEQAERLRSKILYISRDDIMLGEKNYLIQDLIGCMAYDADSSEMLGELTDVSQTGANDVWHITRDSVEYLVPAIKEVVVDVDIDGEKIILRPIKGIFDDAD